MIFKYEVDFLIKIGGSLIDKSPECDALIALLQELAKKYKIIVTTGSRNLADVVLGYVNDYAELSLERRFDVVMRARDTMSLIFCDKGSRLEPIQDFSTLPLLFKQKKVPILLQHHLLQKLQPFDPQLGLSTDTTSCFFAHILSARRYIKLTNVDGIYRNFGTDDSPIGSISTQELLQLGATCVDPKMIYALERFRMNCWVLNGKNVSDLKAFFTTNAALGTHIYPR